MSENTKTDLDRIGLFKEMDYLHGIEYVQCVTKFNEAAQKGKQMMTQCSKSRAANQDGFFEKEFGRIFEGEGYNDPIRLRRMFRLENDKKNREAIFKPSSPTKKPCGAGAYYGTFEQYNKERMEAFSPREREVVKVPCPGKNVLVNPAKKGSGYGYPSVTMSKFPPYFEEGEYEKLKEQKIESPRRPAEEGELKKPFILPTKEGECFDNNPFFTAIPMPIYKEREKPEHVDIPFIPPSPAKKDGGMKAGCINKFPKYMSSPYTGTVVVGRSDKRVVNSSNKLFVPVPGIKPYPIRSIVDINVTKAINRNNCKTTKGVVYCKK